MPRTARASAGGFCYHVINRGNARSQVFHKAEDYQAFVATMAEACIRVPMRPVAFCLMPNHFHLVLWPRADGELSRWMHWLLTTHVRRYLRHYGHSGHVWQGRFKAFPIQQDDHLTTVVRDVERNPLRPAWSSGPRSGPGRAPAPRPPGRPSIRGRSRAGPTGPSS
jgi:putative transposase